ncbi:MAG: NADH/ubiquinone/plastoquinone (complex I) [Spirochaetes bacterium]|nr:MAG: NADH/ubiquinone/plastoquinone (complex I) [Spirochaetota bacterium]
MNMALLPSMVAIPLGIAFFTYLLARKSSILADILGNLATFSILVISILLIKTRGVYVIGGWNPPIGINWVLDGLSNLVLVVVALISFAATIFSTRYMEQYTARYKYYSLFLLMVGGMNGVILTGDLFNLFVFLEVASVASYALVAFGCNHEELEASFKYLVLSSIGSTLVLFGVAFVYGATGYLNMASIGGIMATGNQNTILTVAAVLFIVGFCIKAALVPFHPWLPDAHPSAPAPISAMLSGVLIKALGVYALFRILFNVIGLNQLYGTLLIVLGLLSMTVGVFLAVGQWDFKRLLAYHSISQMGYVILGVGLGGYILATGGSSSVAALAILGGIFHLANHAVFKSLLFLSSGSIEYSTGTRQLKEMGGLISIMPVTRTTCSIASLSIAGVPPFNGFWSKLLIVIAAIQAGFHAVAGITILVSFITLISFLKVLRYAFLGELPEKLKNIKESPALMGVAQAILALFCIGMGLLLLPGPREFLLEPAVNALIQGVEYARIVLSGS